jgi:hypothetical protein
MNLTKPEDMNRAPLKAVIKLANEVAIALKKRQGFKGSVSISVTPVDYHIASEVCKMFRRAGWAAVEYETSGDVRTGESWANFKFME